MVNSLESSRIKNTKRNIVSGLFKQLLNIILPFITRTIIIYFLGAEYQGLSGLFTSILQVLNLTELGFSSAVVFVLYEPVANKQTEKICAIIKYLKIAYRKIGLFIFFLGIAILPFIKNLISSDCPENVNIYILFLIYLFNTIISYLLFAYKGALLTAMQRDDLVSNIYMVSTTLIRVFQIILLLIIKNYYLYIIILPVCTILNNLLLQYYSKKYFPLIIPKGFVSVETKELLTKQIKALFVAKISDIARNSFDNIVISSLLGLIAVAIYDNYYYVYSGVRGILLSIGIAMQASVGNSVVSCDVEKNKHDLNNFTFVFMWIVGWCTVCLLCMYQPFMRLWMNNNANMILSFFDMTLFCMYFYAINMNVTRDLYINACGLYWECRYWYIFDALGNLILNIVLGYFWGMSGILIATIITILLFVFLPRTNILYKCYFKSKCKDFILQHIMYICVTILACGITYYICGLLPLTGIFNLILRMGVCCIIPNLIFALCYIKTSPFLHCLPFVKSVLKKG